MIANFLKVLALSVVISSSFMAMDVTVNKDIKLNDRSLNFPIGIGSLLNIFGPANRIALAANKVYTWDNIGVTAYTKLEDDNVIEICIQIKHEPYPFSPKNSWNGKIIMFDLAVTNALRNNEILQAGYKQENVIEQINFRKILNSIDVNIDSVNNKMGWTRVSITPDKASTSSPK